MGGQAQLSDSAVVTVLKGSLPPFYRCKPEGSVVMFGGVDHRYYKGELNWMPVSQTRYWQISMNR